jgi:uncharacterized protein YhaN
MLTTFNDDDGRAAAGFEVLAELATNTQVFFSTHHSHLVDVAHKTLGADLVSMIEIG